MKHLDSRKKINTYHSACNISHVMQGNFKSKWARCMKNIRVEPWVGGIMGNVVSVQLTRLSVSTVFTS